MKFLYVAIAALSIALLPLPYAGYQAVKWITMLACGFGALKLYERRIADIRFFGLVFIGILFNPIAPFYMARTTWMLWDIATAIFIIWLLLHDKSRAKSMDSPGVTPTLSEKLEDAGDRFSTTMIWSSLGALAMIALLSYLFYS